MKTGIELIAEERKEQIEKHEMDTVYDKNYNTEGQLIAAVKFILTGDKDYYPADWAEAFFRKINRKEDIEKLIIAGALIAAEIDRLKTD